MLRSITLGFSQRSGPIVVPADGITVFVGPNNSGKSLALREIQTPFTGQDRSGLIVKELDIANPTMAELDRDIERLRQKTESSLAINEVLVTTAFAMSITSS